jgi:hypothetical protein
MMTFPRRSAVLLLLLILVFVRHSGPSAAAQATPQNAKPIVVMLAKSRGKLTYKVESKYVTDPLRGLGEQVEKRGEDCPVILYFSTNVTFIEESDLELIASKAGLKNVRAFGYNPDTQIAQELKWGPNIHPFPDPAKS